MKPEVIHAFPGFNYVSSNVHDGMTLRDYFAAKAMQAMLGNYPCAVIGVEIDFRALAGDSYTAADEMLKARAA